jgi:adenylate cyclase
MAREDASKRPPFGQLVPCGGGDPIPLRKPQLLVGRHDACDVVLRFATVSARHCQLEWTDQGWFVRDLGSRNGIRVDGIPCDEKVLAPGCVLSIAGLRYEVVYTTRETDPHPGAKARLFAQSLLEAAGLVHWPAEQDAAGKRKPRAEEGNPQRWTLDDPA